MRSSQIGSNQVESDEVKWGRQVESDEVKSGRVRSGQSTVIKPSQPDMNRERTFSLVVGGHHHVLLLAGLLFARLDTTSLFAVRLLLLGRNLIRMVRLTMN